MSDASELRVVLLHGAFRGGWSLEPVVAGLSAVGIEAVAPDLPGAGEHYDPSHSRLTLADHVAAVWQLVDRPTLLVGHSQGGLVARAVASSPAPDGRDDASIVAVAYLDAIIPGPGQSALSLMELPPGVEAPSSDAWLTPPPRPDGDRIGLRLTPAPASPGLTPMPLGVVSVPEHHAYFADTPSFFPASVTRSEREAAGLAVTILPGGHDAPFVSPGPVVGWIAQIMKERCG